MDDDAAQATRILGRLGAAGDSGVIRIEERYDTGIDDMWTALTDPARLARWYGEVEGDLRLGGEFTLYIAGPDLSATGRVQVCDRPRRLQVLTRETEESWRRGNGAPPYDQTIEATLTADGDQTLVVLEIRGMPLDRIASFGAGWQMHAENLGAYVSGREPAGIEARWGELMPSYEELAAVISQ